MLELVCNSFLIKKKRFRYRESNPGLSRERAECYRYTISDQLKTKSFVTRQETNSYNFIDLTLLQGRFIVPSATSVNNGPRSLGESRPQLSNNEQDHSRILFQ